MTGVDVISQHLLNYSSVILFMMESYVAVWIKEFNSKLLIKPVSSISSLTLLRERVCVCRQGTTELTEIHYVVPTNSTIVHNDVPGPQSHCVPLVGDRKHWR